MSWLLDTCVLSELSAARPDPKVAQWVDAQPHESLFLSILSIGEMHKAVSLLADSQKQILFKKWLESILDRFEGQILPLDAACALEWGRIQAKAKRQRLTIPTVETLFAATALANDLTLITRYTDDFKHLAVPVFNPWE